MPAPRSSSSAGDRSNTVTRWPASASRHAAVNPPSEPPTTAMSTLGSQRGSRLTEGGDLVDRALEQHAAFVDRRISQPVGAGLLCVLRPDLVEVRGDPWSFDRIVLGDLTRDGVLDADPVVGIGRVDKKARQPRVGAYPTRLGAMRGAVDQDEIAFVVEPHRSEVGSTTGADDAEHLRDRIVQQLLVRGLEVGERADRGAIADRELPSLRAGRHVAELGNFDAQGRTPLIASAPAASICAGQKGVAVEGSA